MKLLLYFIFSTSIFLGNLNTSLAQQFLNKEVKPLLEIEQSEDVFSVIGKAENLSNINRSLEYELIVFKENTKTKNKSNNKQTDRFVIEAKEIITLSKTSINVSKTDKVIILLLLKNEEGEIVGRDRKIITDNRIIQKDYDNKVTLKKKPSDGIKLKGVVLERVKTKPGRDFYNFFYSKYMTYNFKDSRAILVEEIHDRGRNTKIFIKLDNRKIYEFFVQPNLDYLKRNVDVAIRVLYQEFEKKEKDYIVRY
ncbi:CsgE family curli-type amyloid fiber assembly protein [Pseudofulvibacter geojedonensis]|uniref:Curli production assembly/transport component CsgE n=1 Tax=Pseudofulvibacter geojedonensis TaxID=1123758 RepID=A0ABW3I2Y6_9FLAO